MMSQNHSLTSKFIIKLTQGTMNIQCLIKHLLLITNQPTRLTIKVLILMKIQLQQPMAHLDHLIKALIKVIDKVQYHMDPIHHKVMDRDQGQIV